MGFAISQEERASFIISFPLAVISRNTTLLLLHPRLPQHKHTPSSIFAIFPHKNPFKRFLHPCKVHCFSSRSITLYSSSFQRPPLHPLPPNFKKPFFSFVFLGSILFILKLPYAFVSLSLQTIFKTISVCLVFENRFQSLKIH